MTSTETLRYAGIRGTVDRWLDPNADYALTTGATREGIAFTINGLAILGRSSKWKAAVRRWADMVTDEENDLRWALVEGSTGVTRAA